MLGAIADDFTGATDLANNLVARGFKTRVLTRTPALHEIEGASTDDAVVIALKTRSAPVAEAVTATGNALRVLRALGATRFYDKYCSTFDSTPEGNIGPIAETLMAELGLDRTIAVPAFPDNGRTVYQGRLFVGAALLSDSPMRDHPLTPMTDSNITALLQPQTRHRVRLVDWQTVRAGKAAVQKEIAAAPGIYVIDALDRTDLTTIAEATAGLALVTGGSGLAQGLTGPRAEAAARNITSFSGRRVVLAGSASTATRRQVAVARQAMPSRQISLDTAIDRFDDEIAGICAWANTHWAADPDRPVLVYSVGDAADIKTAQPAAAATVESVLSTLASRFVADGVRQIIVAGGETSGALVRELGLDTLEIGPQIAAGVVWASAQTDDNGLNIALKSGNFGSDDMFVSAWDLLP